MVIEKFFNKVICNLINYFVGEVIVISTHYLFSVIFTTLLYIKRQCQC
jgi:hypothetical protein